MAKKLFILFIGITLVIGLAEANRRHKHRHQHDSQDNAGYDAGYAQGFLDGADSCVLPDPDPQPDPDPDPEPDPDPQGVWMPTPGTTWQWQLTGNIDTGVQADVYDIDGFDVAQSVINELKADGRHLICYFSAGSWEDWRDDADDFPAAVLGNGNGWPGERWLDIRRLDVLMPIMEARMDVCKAKGFDAIEPDNIDGYSNSTGFSLSGADQLAYNKALAAAAHVRGLSIGFKNNVEQAGASEPFFDFAINEECFMWDECGELSVFIDAGKAVFHAEYDLDLDEFCDEANDLGFSSILKDINLGASVSFCS